MSVTISVIRAAAALALVPLVAAAPALASDRDGDGLSDGFESRYGVTSPDLADTDGDGVIDSAEDSDRDRLSNLGEQRFKTNPGKRDSDGDGRPDGNEDSDHNGLSNALQQDKRRVPVGLTPALPDAHADDPQPGECNTPHRSSQVRPCELGDTTSVKTIAIWGDSHARQWIPTLDRVGSKEGWKVIQLTKSACPSIAVTVRPQWYRDRGVSCRRWRSNVLAWLDAHPPDVVIITNYSHSRLVNRRGRLVPTSRRAKVWARAMPKTLEALPAGAAVIILADTPLNRGKPLECMKAHRFNMAACTTRRHWALATAARKVERQVAKAYGAKTINLNDKICTYDPCPLVQGDVLVWRNRSHMTATFARKLWPTLRDRIVWAAGDALNPARRARRTR